MSIKTRHPPALPRMPLRIPARLGRDLLFLLLCSFSIDRYLFFMWAGTTTFSKSLFCILGSSINPSFWRKACFIFSWSNPSVKEISVAQRKSWMSKAMLDLLVVQLRLCGLNDWVAGGLYTCGPPTSRLAFHTLTKGRQPEKDTLQSHVPFRPAFVVHHFFI